MFDRRLIEGRYIRPSGTDWVQLLRSAEFSAQPFDIVWPPVPVWAGEFRSFFNKYSCKAKKNKKRRCKSVHILTSYYSRWDRDSSLQLLLMTHERPCLGPKAAPRLTRQRPRAVEPEEERKGPNEAAETLPLSLGVEQTMAWTRRLGSQKVHGIQGTYERAEQETELY